MQSVLSKVARTTTAAASKAGNKVSEVIEITKLKGKINSERQAISSEKNDIGEYCYELFEAGKIKDDNIKEHCIVIQECEDNIADLQDRIEEVKAEYRAKSENDPVVSN